MPDRDGAAPGDAAAALGDASDSAVAATSSIVVEAPAAEVFGLLIDPQAFGNWVVGARRIRAVAPEWPAVGATFLHSVGIGPLGTRDSSEIRAVTLNRLLELEVRFRPGGSAIVTVTLEPVGRRLTRVELGERPLTGPLRWAWSTPIAAALQARNDWSLRRLRRLVESRATAGRSDELVPDVAATAAGIVVEEVVYDLDPADVADWVTGDAATWTADLAQRPGFVGKQVWEDVAEPGRVRVMVWWSDDAEGRAGRDLHRDETASAESASGTVHRGRRTTRQHRLVQAG